MSTYHQRENKYKRKLSDANPFQIYDRSMKLKGTIDEVIRDSISGHGGAILHAASTPDEYGRLFIELEKHARVKYRGQIAKEVNGADASRLVESIIMPDDLVEIEMRRPRAGNAAALAAWDKESLIPKTAWAKKRETYFGQVDEMKGHIETLMSHDIQQDLHKNAAYTDEFNNETGSLRAYLDILVENLAQILPWSRTNSTAEVEKNIKDLKIYKCGCALEYHTRILALIKLLKVAKANIEKESLLIEEIEDDVVRNQFSARIDASKSVEVDSDVTIIKAIWDEIIGHGMDLRGKQFYKDEFSNSQCKIDSTPYSKRTVVNNEVKGGLNNMLTSFKVTLDRIKAENPTMKIHYISNNPDLGNKLKTGKDNDIKINAAEVRAVELDPYDDVDFKNKDASKKPCTFCRDKLVRFNVCKNHSYDNCFYNPNCKSQLAVKKPEVKKTAEQRKKAEDDSKAKRDYVKEKKIGRH